MPYLYLDALLLLAVAYISPKPILGFCGWSCLSSSSTLAPATTVSSSSCSSSRISSSDIRMEASNSGSTTVSGATVQKPMPRVKPLPPAIVSTEPGTWAYDTMSRRLNEEILERTWQDCLEDWAKDDEAAEKYEEVKQRFQAFRDELSAAANTRLSYLEPLPPAASKVRRQEWQDWHDILEPYIAAKNTWLTAPWMVTEFYAYRRLMECLGYFDEQSPCYMYDPFAKQKRAGLVSSTASAEPMLAKINVLAETTVDDEASGIRLASDVALWGNKMDLSLWPADASDDAADVFTEILHKAAENLLSDDSEKLAEHCRQLKAKGGGNVDIIVDNAGFELVTDLALAQYLIESGIASTVTFQLKSHPTFVSDALEKDLLDTVDYYLNQVDATRFPACRSAATRWLSYLEHGQWQTIENSFWVQGLPMWDMPDALRTDLAERCHLAVVKGDANYRRLLGDRPFDFAAAFEDVVGCYFPCPVLALRALKAELGCGMPAEQTARAAAADPNWLVNGRFGVLQFGKH